VYVSCVSSRGTDFFISQAGRDTAWAEWLAWQFQQAGYTVELDVWDWTPGEDFVPRMSAALELCSQRDPAQSLSIRFRGGRYAASGSTANSTATGAGSRVGNGDVSEFGMRQG
jgi:hypothetical protein